MIRVIHLSDFHLESDILPHGKTEILEALVDDLKKYVTEDTLIFFTGDLLDKGGVAFKKARDIAFLSFEEFFIGALIKSFPILDKRIFVVPGNHDVFRDKIDQVSDAGLKHTLTDRKTVDTFIEKNRSEAENLHLTRLEDYKAWERMFYSTYPEKLLSNFDNSFKLKIGDVNVGITCLNSSWLCKDDDDKGNLVIGEEQIKHSLAFIKDAEIKLVLAHHPLEFLYSFDQQNIKSSIFKDYNMFFTGHVHELSSAYTQELNGSVFISIANSTIGENPQLRKHVNGYTVVDLFPGERVETTYRKFVESAKKFVTNTDVGTDDGRKVYPILRDESLTEYSKVTQLVENLGNQISERLNEHLILTSNNTEVNCSIEHLFVSPSIYNYPENVLKAKDISDLKEYDIESILTLDSNFLIYGIKESGKTILIDKLFIEATKFYKKYSKIPLLFKYQDFKDRDFIKVVRMYLGVSAARAHELLSKYHTLLLIDDLNFNDRNGERLEELKRTLGTFPLMRIVATSSVVLETVIPTDYLIHNDVFKFQLGFLQSFNAHQIKSLIAKWSVGKKIDYQEKMEQLLKSFRDFGLPKTPLSVTLFLWIFEKQEKKPINNSVLVELFVENLLEKANIENIYSDTFDFKNKLRLLSFIAKRMKDEGEEDLNYAIDYVKLLDFIDSYLKTRFSGQPQKVLEDFLRRGIFTYEDSNLIKFKSAFTFHYFLALHLDYDPKFKEEVLTGDNYLAYTEELVYYTGLKRDDVQILEFVQTKLLEAFGDFNNDVIDNFKQIDVVLETKAQGTIAYKIDEEKNSVKLSEKDLDAMYDAQLANTPIQKVIPKKDSSQYSTTKNIDRVLRLAANILKNSEDIDDYSLKTAAYSSLLTSAISFLMQYRNSLILYHIEHKKQPDHFPKNIDFHLFITFLPMIHQVVLYEWLGTQKLRPVILDKIKLDRQNDEISQYEKFLSIFMYADIKGKDYPELIKDFVKESRLNYIKDLSFVKINSYYHLRTNNPAIDEFYLKLMSEIKTELGHVEKDKKSQFILRMENQKRKKG